MSDEASATKLRKKIRTFYWYFRPIAIICTILGVLPLQYVYHRDGSKLRFRVRSIPHFYSGLTFYSTAYVLFNFSGFVFFSNLDDIGFIWRCIALYVMMIRSGMCFLYCTTHAKKFTKLIKLLEAFDIKKVNMLSIEENTGMKRLMIWTIMPLITGFVLLSCGFYELKNVAEGILKESIKHPQQLFIASTLFGMLGTWQMAPILLYMYFMMIIKTNLMEIVRILKSNKAICHFLMDNSDKEMNCIANTRHIYTIMTSSVKKISDTFGSFLAIDQFCLITMFVVNIYVFFFTNNKDIHLLISTLLNAIIVGGVINISDKIKDMGRKILDLLERYSMSSFDSTSQMELQTFLLQAAIHPIEISAAGFFTMDRTQIPAILSAVASYIIVLVQLSPQIGTQKNGTIVIHT